MQKQAPTPAKLVVMVVFVLSCFGLLLFLWLSFGGSTPLRPGGWRFKVALPQAASLADQSDVRVAGISVGKVVGKELDAASNRTVATVQLDSRFAPLHADARAILRQKTLLGETYVELTLGSRASPAIPEGGTLGNTRVEKSIALDEVLSAFDPITRRALRSWQQDVAQGVRGHGRDIGDAIGRLPALVGDLGDALALLDSQSAAVRRLFGNGSVTFAALSEHRAALRRLITSSGRLFAAAASQRSALAATIGTLPTFLDETKATLARVRSFAQDTDPLVAELRPAARALKPALGDVRRLSADLRHAFARLAPLIDASRSGLPALRQVLDGAGPLLAALQPFLEQLNPVLQFLELYQHQTAGFFSAGGGGTAARTVTQSPDEIGHWVPQIAVLGPQSLAVWRGRLPAWRGNAYLGPVALQGSELATNMIFPTLDCNHAGGETKPDETPGTGHPGCTVQAPIDFQGRRARFTQIGAADYSKP